METKERFARNLDDGMTKHGLTEQQLAEELGMDRYWRKWLRRVLKYGLERPNTNSREMLEKLAKRLGFGSAQNIWLGHFDADLATIEAFRKLWATASEPMKLEIERQISEWQQEVERQVTERQQEVERQVIEQQREVERRVIQRRRIQVAEVIARMKFSWDDLSREERFASSILEPSDYIGITGEELDVLDWHGLMSKVVLDIIVEKELSPELPPNDIWNAVRPELVRMVKETQDESRRKFPNKEQVNARVPK